MRLLLVPATVAWFAGAVWYMTKQNACNCLPGVSSPAVAASPIHLGPASTEAPAEAPSVSAASVAPSPTVTSETTSIAFEPDRTVRFLKNTQDVAWTEDELRWCESVRAYLLANTAATVTVTGHTDGDGDPALNEDLSLRRAGVVRAALIDLGLPSERIIALGAGSTAPVADNTTSKGKALNRRVEIHVGSTP